ncbi:Gp138 family membrane-puncturing spike protein [Aliarcobacter butzleri]|uniref:Gp138 family membrane-puncturing spike protein n=1 Tax=Aliarcobacter butzleri TaxID=28197 RepID=UPI003B21EA13
MINNNNGALDLASTIGLGVIQALTNTHTNLIGKVVKVNKKTIDVQPVIAREVDGETIPLPVFPDVPIINFLGGDSSIQMPIAIGDYCQLFVNERCLDNWYFGNDNKKPLSPRMFDYSDCVALVGLKNKNGELEIPDRIKMTGDCLQIGDYEHQGNREQLGNYILEGNISQVGDHVIDGDILINGKSLWSFINEHTHSGVQSGSNNTGVPNI